MVSYYSTSTYIRWCLCFEKGRKLQLVKNDGEGETVLAQVDAVPETAVFLRIVVAAQTRSFFYSFDGKAWSEAGSLAPCHFLADEGRPGSGEKRHTGTLTGIYANNGGCGSRIPADFDYVAFSFKN